MLRKISFIVMVLALGLIMAIPAFAAPGKPDFSTGLYADGETWGTKGTTDLPGPNGKNDQSFDKLFVFTNGAMGQLPVAEAAPGNPDYNGGRWARYDAAWVGGTPEVLKSYDEVMDHVENGDIILVDAEVYFQCPLLPVK
jgi:hypothetical protein